MASQEGQSSGEAREKKKLPLIGDLDDDDIQHILECSRKSGSKFLTFLMFLEFVKFDAVLNLFTGYLISPSVSPCREVFGGIH